MSSMTDRLNASAMTWSVQRQDYLDLYVSDTGYCNAHTQHTSAEQQNLLLAF